MTPASCSSCRPGAQPQAGRRHQARTAPAPALPRVPRRTRRGTPRRPAALGARLPRRRRAPRESAVAALSLVRRTAARSVGRRSWASTTRAMPAESAHASDALGPHGKIATSATMSADLWIASWRGGQSITIRSNAAPTRASCPGWCIVAPIATTAGGWRLASEATAAHVLAVPWGSPSTRSTRWPRACHSHATEIAAVDLPAPPFCPANAMIIGPASDGWLSKAKFPAADGWRLAGNRQPLAVNLSEALQRRSPGTLPQAAHSGAPPWGSGGGSAA